MSHKSSWLKLSYILLCRNKDRQRNNDFDYTRRNIFGQPTVQQTGIDAIFDPIDADTPEFFDYDSTKTRVDPNYNSEVGPNFINNK